jgi:hypothetical protein
MQLFIQLHMISNQIGWPAVVIQGPFIFLDLNQPPMKAKKKMK